MKLSRNDCRKPAELLKAVAIELGSENVMLLSEEFSRMQRNLYRAWFYPCTGKSPYRNRLDRRKARHQKRNQLRDSIEGMHEDRYLDLREMAEADAWYGEFFAYDAEREEEERWRREQEEDFAYQEFLNNEFRNNHEEYFDYDPWW